MLETTLNKKKQNLSDTIASQVLWIITYAIITFTHTQNILLKQ